MGPSIDEILDRDVIREDACHEWEKRLTLEEYDLWENFIREDYLKRYGERIGPHQMLSAIIDRQILYDILYEQRKIEESKNLLRPIFNKGK